MKDKTLTAHLDGYREMLEVLLWLDDEMDRRVYEAGGCYFRKEDFKKVKEVIKLVMGE